MNNLLNSTSNLSIANTSMTNGDNTTATTTAAPNENALQSNQALGTESSIHNPDNQQKDTITVMRDILDVIQKKIDVHIRTHPEDIDTLTKLKVSKTTYLELLELEIKSTQGDSISKDKEPKEIPEDKYPVFDPRDWKSGSTSSDDVTGRKRSCRSFLEFVNRFQSVLTTYGKNIENDWFSCLKRVFEITSHSEWFDNNLGQKIKSNKKFSWDKAKLVIQTRFDLESRTPQEWAKMVKTMKQDASEKLLAFLDRYSSALVGSLHELSEPHVSTNLQFIESLLPKYQELVYNFLQKEYKPEDVEMNSSEDRLPWLPKSIVALTVALESGANSIETSFSSYALERKRAASPSKHDSHDAKRLKSKSKDNDSNGKPETSGNTSTFTPRACTKCNFFPFSYKHIQQCPGKPPAGEGKSGSSYKKSHDKKVNFAAITSSDQASSCSSVGRSDVANNGTLNDNSIDPKYSELDYYLTGYNSDYSSADDSHFEVNDDNSSILSGKVDKICLTVKRSSYTFGDNNPYNSTDPSFSPVTPIIIQDLELTGLLDSGSEISLINKDFANTNHIKYEKVDGNLVFIDGTQVSRMRTVAPLQLLYDGIDSPITHYFDVVAESKAFGKDQILIGRDLIPKLGITPFVNVAYKYKNKNLRIPDDSIKDQRYEPNVSPAGTDHEQQCFYDFISPSLERNRALDPHSFCNLPEAVVHLNTPPNEYVHIKQYPIADKLIPQVTSEIQKLLDNGIVEPAKPSPWNLPLTVAKKKDSEGNLTKIRLVLDPRMLNKLLPVDKFPLPLISDIFQAMANSVVWSTVDLVGAFNQFPLFEQDRVKTTFTAPNGLTYMYKGTPFGLSIISQQFSRVMLTLFKDLPFCKSFVDDIVIFSKSMEEHAEHVKTVLEIITAANLRVNVDKCFFAKSAVYLLGFVIDKKGRRIDPRKLTNVLEWPPLTSHKQVQQFIGTCNFFREHIPNAAKLMVPLNALKDLANKQKGKQFAWTDIHQSHFQALKEVLASEVVLGHPVPNVPYRLATDSSAYATGCVLYQDIDEGDSKRRNFIGFMARSFSPSERRWSATMRELAGIVFALVRFHKIIWGSRFVLECDHKSLSYMFSQRHTNHMLEKWLNILLDYTFDVVHIEGLKNVLPDRLSRLFEPLEENQTSLVEGNQPDYYMPYLKNMAMTDSFNLKKQNNPIINKFVSDCPKANDRKLFYIQSDQAILPDRVVPDEKDRRILLSEAHDEIGHYGAEQIVKRLHTDGFHWPKLMNDAIEFVRQCDQCQKHNIVRRGYSPLKSIYAYVPGDHWAIDLGQGPTTIKNDSGASYFLVMVDVCTRFCILKPVVKKTAAEIAQLLIDVFSTFGYPAVLQSDNGTEFSNSLIKDLNDAMGVNHRFITPLKASTNGLAERYVQSTKKMLRKATMGIGKNWDFYLPSIQLALNNQISKRLNSTPFSLMFARNLNTIKDLKLKHEKRGNMPHMSVEELLKRVDYMSDIVFPAIIEKNAVSMKRAEQSFNKTHNLVEFSPGDYVMVRLQSSDGNLTPVYEGPYTVVRKTTGGSYVLRDETGVLMHRNYGPYELKLVSKEEVVESDGRSLEKSYEVEAIMDHRGSVTDREYLVRWKHYSSDWDEWVPTNKFNDVNIIRKYWKNLGVPYKPKKNNIVTNAPPGITPDGDAQFGTVANALKKMDNMLEPLLVSKKKTVKPKPVPSKKVRPLPATGVRRSNRLSGKKRN